MSDLVRDWTPAAIMGLLAFLANTYRSWRRDKRDEATLQQTLEERASAREMSAEEKDEARYRAQIDGIITALERRVGMAETGEQAALARVGVLSAEIVRVRADCAREIELLKTDYATKIAALEGTVGSLSRRLAEVTHR